MSPVPCLVKKGRQSGVLLSRVPYEPCLPHVNGYGRSGTLKSAKRNSILSGTPSQGFARRFPTYKKWSLLQLYSIGPYFQKKTSRVLPCGTSDCKRCKLVRHMLAYDQEIFV